MPRKTKSSHQIQQIIGHQTTTNGTLLYTVMVLKANDSVPVKRTYLETKFKNKTARRILNKWKNKSK